MKRILTMGLLLALLAGCGSRTGGPDDQLLEPPPAMETAGTEDLMAGIGPGQTGADDAAGEQTGVITDFGLRLFQNCFDGRNTLVSPLSVMEALAMAANGAAGQTLAQMETALGLDTEALNACLRGYARSLPSDEGGAVELANGIWLNADGAPAVREDFLQTNADYYGAAARTAPFDSGTAGEINRWVAERTKDRIPSIVSDLPAGGMMVLVNALTFDGVWEEIYRADQVRSGTFTDREGHAQPAEFLYSTETTLLRDGGAVGFLKYYAGRGYAFAALLPEEGTALEEYAASLTGERLQAVLDGADENAHVSAAIPKFTAEYGGELGGALGRMGMTDAFDSGLADFSRLADSAGGNLYIDQIQHRTMIRVDEHGTQAGAATAVEIAAASLMEEQTVHLDRPFLYMLVDCRAKAPLFIGAVTELS